jgi:general secretion pathway protein G
MMQRIRQLREQEGFTLIELLIVIVILGILAAIVVFAVGGITDRGVKSACKSDLKSVEVAVEAYYAKNGSYPAAIGDLTAAPDKFLRAAPAGSGYTITLGASNGAVSGDLTGGAATTDCSA